MLVLLALLIGLLFGAAVYLILRRSTIDLVFGLVLLTHAANLLVFVSGGIRRASPPLLEEDAAQSLADPIPQALVLTAIVIGFGVVAFTAVLVGRLYRLEGTDDGERMEPS